jgi:AbrB family looped-hinge helix DNA binding protein
VYRKAFPILVEDIVGASAKVTSKGQITLPAEWRAEHGVEPGDSLVFFRDLDGLTRIAIDRRRDRAPRAVVRYDGPPLDVAMLDPAAPRALPRLLPVEAK